MSTQKQPSLQSILKRRQQMEFIGREEQVNLFRQNLTYGPVDERRRFIFSASGQGGVGKTTLLRLFSKLATEANAKVAWVDETIEDMPAAMAYIAKQLEGQDHAFNTFNERYRIYLQRLHELEADPEAPQGSLSIISQALTKVGVSLGRRIPIAGGALDLIDEKVLATQVGAWSEYVKRKLTNKDEFHLIQKPLDILTPLFLDGLMKEAEKHCVVLFLDTYERTGEYLDNWLRKLLDGFYGDLSSNIIIVIAGRHELDKNKWIIYEGLLVRFELEPFTEAEARDYLARKGIIDKRTVEVILHLSGSFPLLLATLASESPSNPDQVGDPSGTAIERFLKWEDDPKYRQLLLDAALPRYLNRDVIAVILGNKKVDSFFAWLKQKPFLEQRGKGWVYHELVRSQMLRYTCHESPQNWFTLQGKLADYYEQLYNNPNFNNEVEQKRSSLNSLLELCYHRICQSPQRELIRSIAKFPYSTGDAESTYDSMASLWVNMVFQALKDCDTEEKEARSQIKKIAAEAAQLSDKVVQLCDEYSCIVEKYNKHDETLVQNKYIDDLITIAAQIDSILKVFGLDKTYNSQELKTETEKLKNINI